jgi:hypothetical protein
MRSACQVNQFTTQFTFFTSTKVQILTLTRLAETWEQDFELAVVQTGMAHLLMISREFDFVNAASYSDTHEAPHLQPQAQPRRGRDRGADCRAGGSRVCSSDRGAAESSLSRAEHSAEHSREPHSRAPHSQNAAKGGKKGGEREEEDVREDVSEESARGPPEVGQLMFAMPGRLVERGSTVKVRVAHGENGFTAFLLP